MKYLEECSDLEFQKKFWGKDHDGIHEGVTAVFDYIVEDENLDVDAGSAVGYYLLDDEVQVIENFARELREVHHDMKNAWDEREALNHPKWPEVLVLARAALEKINSNNSVLNFKG